MRNQLACPLLDANKHIHVYNLYIYVGKGLLSSPGQNRVNDISCF